MLLLLRLSSTGPTMAPRAQHALLKASQTEAGRGATMEWCGMQDWQLKSMIDSILTQGGTGNELAIELPRFSPAVPSFN